MPEPEPGGSMLTDGEIASMRETCDGTLDSTAVLQRKTYVDNLGGGGSLTWAAAGTYPCHLSNSNAAQTTADTAEEGSTGRVEPETDWIMTLPALVTVDETMRAVTLGGTFEVTMVREPRTWELARRVELTEVNP